MYMNCAVVDIQPNKLGKAVQKDDDDSDDEDSEDTSKSDYSGPNPKSDSNNNRRDTVVTYAKAQAALSSYPDLFVANLAKINDCKTKETVDVVFGNPGKDVTYEDNESSSAKPSYKRGEC